MTRRLALATLIALTTLPCFGAETLKIKGTWIVDLEPTMASLKTKPIAKKLTPEQYKPHAKVLRDLAKTMQLTIGDGTLTLKTSLRTQTMATTVKESTKDKVVLEAEYKAGRKVFKRTMTFTMVKGRLNVVTDLNPDLKHYFWKPAPEKMAKDDAGKDG